MERERVELERYSILEAELHQQQLKRKQDLLQHLLQQQNDSDTLIQRMQKEKDSERQKLIDDILKGERIIDKFGLQQICKCLPFHFDFSGSKCWHDCRSIDFVEKWPGSSVARTGARGTGTIA